MVGCDMVPLFMPFQFQEAEKKRYRAEQQRFETKHRRQLEESRATANSAVKELEQLQVRVGLRSQAWQFIERTTILASHKAFWVDDVICTQTEIIPSAIRKL